MDVERFDPKSTGRIAYEHLHRYAVCSDHVVGAKVLDVGSGAGYGPAILGLSASHVTGVDIDAETVERARLSYGKPGKIEFVQGDCGALPFEDGEFDVVVALEIIEHIAQPAKLVAEARRVLKTGGLFIVSTPDREVYNRYKTPNPYHLREMSRPEFSSLLAREFPYVEILGQSMSIVSAITPLKEPDESANRAEYRGYSARRGAPGSVPEVKPGLERVPEPEYYLAFCSQNPVDLTSDSYSMFWSGSDDLWAEHAGVMYWAANLHGEDEELRRDLAAANEKLDDKARKESELASKIEMLEADLKERDRLHSEVNSSNENLVVANQTLQRTIERLGETDDFQAWKKGEPTLSGGLKMVNGLLARISGAPVTADIPSLIDVLAQTAVKLSTNELQVNALEAASHRATEEATTLRHALENESAERKRLAHEIVRAAARAEKAEIEATEAETRARTMVEDLSAEVKRLSARAEKAESEANGAETRSQAVAENLSAEVKRISAALSMAQDRHEVDARRQASLEAELVALKAPRDEEARALQRARIDRSRLERDHALALARVDEMQRREEAGEPTEPAELARLKSELVSANERCDEAVRRQAALTSELATLAARSREDADVHEAMLADRVREVEAELSLKAAEHAAATEAAHQRALNDVHNKISALTGRADAYGLRDEVQQELRSASNCVRSRVKTWKRADTPSPFEPTSSDWRTLVEADLFDADWYAHQVPQLTAEEAFDHFRTIGFADGRDPNPLFSSSWYASSGNPADPRLPPLIDYLRRADRTEASTHPLFDPKYYLAMHTDVAAAGIDPLQHYLQFGARERRETHPLVSIDWILRTWPQHLAPDFNLKDYVTRRELFELAPHQLFDAQYYMLQHQDTAGNNVNPLQHYLEYGWKEGSSPHPLFCNDWYMAEYQECIELNMAPLHHYVERGALNLLDVNPLFDSTYYVSSHIDAAKSGLDPLTHFVVTGAAQGFATSRRANFSKEVERFLESAGTHVQNRLEWFIRETDARAPATPEAVITQRGRIGVAADSPPIEPLADFQIEPRSDRADPLDEHWPPKPINGYWLPQALRDYIIENHGEACVDAYWHLFSVIETHADDPDAFGSSREVGPLLRRAKALAKTHLSATPRTSIIVPVFGKLLYTLTCVVSVLETCGADDIEIVIGDDASPDETQEVMSQIGGVVRVVTHPANLGFLGNCNETATHARGSHIVFLNNDTIVLPHWLDKLTELLYRDPTIGLVGSKLLNGNGTLQEAGGLMWRDGSAWNFGRGSDPRRPEFNYVKEADYCSGASIAMPADLWRDLNGFDPHYAPAYCEDSDIAFRVRERGLKVIYQPQSELVHHEGRSHGRDPSVGVKAYQVANQVKLFERWGATLERENLPNGEDVFVARDRSRTKPHILIVDHYIPQWDRDAGSRTVFQYIRLFLDSGFHVTFWPDNMYHDRPYASILQSLGVEVLFNVNEAMNFQNWITINGAYLDYILLNRPHIAPPYVPLIREHSKAKILYYGHDLHFARLKTQHAVMPSEDLLSKASAMEKVEAELCSAVDVFLYPSAEEVEQVQRRIGDSSQGVAIPMNVFRDDEIADFDTRAFNARDRRQLLFVGGFGHPPNGDAVMGFCQSVMPLLLAEDPSVVLSVVGSNPSSAIHDLGGPNVRVLGRVSDDLLRALYRSAGVVVAPLRYGGGVKGKVIEALAHGAPVVSSGIGAQGIPDADQMMILAETPEAFAAAILACGRDVTETAGRVRRGIDFVRANYTSRAVVTVLRRFIPQLGLGSLTSLV